MDLGVDPLGEGGVDAHGQLPEPRGPRIDQVDEWTRIAGTCREPSQGRSSREIEMISDHYKITGPELRSQGAGRIGDDDRPASRRHSRPDRMDDGHGPVSLVEVETAEEGQNVQITDLERPDL